MISLAMNPLGSDPGPGPDKPFPEPVSPPTPDETPPYDPVGVPPPGPDVTDPGSAEPLGIPPGSPPEIPSGPSLWT